jgi:hypothetical protein
MGVLVISASDGVLKPCCEGVDHAQKRGACRPRERKGNSLYRVRTSRREMLLVHLVSSLGEVRSEEFVCDQAWSLSVGEEGCGCTQGVNFPTERRT